MSRALDESNLPEDIVRYKPSKQLLTITTIITITIDITIITIIILIINYILILFDLPHYYCLLKCLLLHEYLLIIT